MDAAQICVAALREGAQQIERGGGLPVGLDLPARIGPAGLFGELVAVDDVAAIARQAMRPTFTTGEEPAKVSTTAIWRKTRKKSRMLLAPCSAKLSAQSPPCSKKASPPATRASAFLRLRASPANTSGGKVASCFSVSASAARSG